jgi:HSP20 family protein
MVTTPVEVKKTQSAPAAAPDALRSFRSEMDRLFDRFSGSLGLPSLHSLFAGVQGLGHEPSFGIAPPAVDVSEGEKAYIIAAELPGTEEKDIEVSVSGDVLVLKGEKKHEKEERKKNFYLSERSYGSFQRAFRLPETVNRDQIAAQFAKGVLTVTLPKTADAQKQQKKIEIKSA